MIAQCLKANALESDSQLLPITVVISNSLVKVVTLLSRITEYHNFLR